MGGDCVSIIIIIISIIIIIIDSNQSQGSSPASPFPRREGRRECRP
jgi:hypothetical protein